jgi:hypothetical protein
MRRGRNSRRVERGRSVDVDDGYANGGSSRVEKSMESAGACEWARPRLSHAGYGSPLGNMASVKVGEVWGGVQVWKRAGLSGVLNLVLIGYHGRRGLHSLHGISSPPAKLGHRPSHRSAVGQPRRVDWPSHIFSGLRLGVSCQKGAFEVSMTGVSKRQACFSSCVFIWRPCSQGIRKRQYKDSRSPTRMSAITCDLQVQAITAFAACPPIVR